MISGAGKWRVPGRTGAAWSSGSTRGAPSRSDIRLSVIIPALNEGAVITDTLRQVRGQLGSGDELLVVDGGSADDTVARAEALADRVLHAAAGRAHQMNAGAAAATREWLWFLHADTRPEPGAVASMRRALRQGRHPWGRFGVQLSGRSPVYRLIAASMNLRSCVTGIATGDQGIFVQAALFERVGGFPRVPLMEDVALSRSLRAWRRPACLSARLVTSSRRWETHGTWRTVTLMWRLRWAYWRGADPRELARQYRRSGA